MTTSEALVARALGYPYPREPAAFVWRAGRVEPFNGTIPAGAVPCVAHGSNASPQQLDRKFGDISGIEIPTIPAELPDHDVVYEARICSYGSVCATLAPSPGTRVQVWLQWLSPAALSRMDETEGVPEVYERVVGLGVTLAAGRSPAPEATLHYRSKAGPLLFSGEPMALMAIPAAGRQFGPLDQRGVQRLVAERLGVVVSVEDFIHENVADAALRIRRNAHLRQLR